MTLNKKIIPIYDLLKKYQKIKKKQLEYNQKDYEGNHCCAVMDYYVHKSDRQEPSPIVYKPRLREYYFQSIENSEGNPIHFCPECGTQLPKKLGDAWFDIIGQEYQLNPWIPHQRKKIPDEFFSDEWWKKRNI